MQTSDTQFHFIINNKKFAQDQNIMSNRQNLFKIIDYIDKMQVSANSLQLVEYLLKTISVECVFSFSSFYKKFIGNQGLKAQFKQKLEIISSLVIYMMHPYDIQCLSYYHIFHRPKIAKKEFAGHNKTDKQHEFVLTVLFILKMSDKITQRNEILSKDQKRKLKAIETKVLDGSINPFAEQCLKNLLIKLKRQLNKVKGIYNINNKEGPQLKQFMLKLKYRQNSFYPNITQDQKLCSSPLQFQLIQKPHQILKIIYNLINNFKGQFLLSFQIFYEKNILFNQEGKYLYKQKLQQIASLVSSIIKPYKFQQQLKFYFIFEQYQKLQVYQNISKAQRQFMDTIQFLQNLINANKNKYSTKIQNKQMNKINEIQFGLFWNKYSYFGSEFIRLMLLKVRQSYSLLLSNRNALFNFSQTQKIIHRPNQSELLIGEPYPFQAESKLRIKQIIHYFLLNGGGVVYFGIKNTYNPFFGQAVGIELDHSGKKLILADIKQLFLEILPYFTEDFILQFIHVQRKKQIDNFSFSGQSLQQNSQFNNNLLEDDRNQQQKQLVVMKLLIPKQYKFILSSYIISQQKIKKQLYLINKQINTSLTKKVNQNIKKQFINQLNPQKQIKRRQIKQNKSFQGQKPKNSTEFIDLKLHQHNKQKQIVKIISQHVKAKQFSFSNQNQQNNNKNLSRQDVYLNDEKYNFQVVNISEQDLIQFFIKQKVLSHIEIVFKKDIFKSESNLMIIRVHKNYTMSQFNRIKVRLQREFSKNKVKVYRISHFLKFNNARQLEMTVFIMKNKNQQCYCSRHLMGIQNLIVAASLFKQLISLGFIVKSVYSNYDILSYNVQK